MSFSPPPTLKKQTFYRSWSLPSQSSPHTHLAQELEKQEGYHRRGGLVAGPAACSCQQGEGWASCSAVRCMTHRKAASLLPSKPPKNVFCGPPWLETYRKGNSGKHSSAWLSWHITKPPFQIKLQKFCHFTSKYFRFHLKFPLLHCRRAQTSEQLRMAHARLSWVVRA